MFEIIVLIAVITLMVILPLVVGLALNSTDDHYDYYKHDGTGKCSIEDYYLADRLSR